MRNHSELWERGTDHRVGGPGMVSVHLLKVCPSESDTEREQRGTDRNEGETK